MLVNEFPRDRLPSISERDMLVSNVTLEHCSGFKELAATIILPNDLPVHPDPRTGRALTFSSIRLWFRFPIEIAGNLTSIGDPFLAALLPVAIWAQDHELILDCPISKVLLDQSRQLVEMLSAGLGIRPELKVSSTGSPDNFPENKITPQVPRRAAFFSGGVDSFYTVLKHLHDRRGWITPLSDLIFIQSDAVQATPIESEFFALTQHHLHSAASKLGLPLHTITTNVSEVHNRFGAYALINPGLGIPGDRLAINCVTLGSALWSVATGLQHTFQQLLIPAHYSYAAGSEIFHMSSPVTDPLWSTDLLQVVHDGAEATRLEKVLRRIAVSDVALQHLSVCWYNAHLGQRSSPESQHIEANSLNCGRCEKCMRTQLELCIAGVRTSPTLFQPLDIDECIVRITNFKSPLSNSQLRYYQEMQAYLLNNACSNDQFRHAIDSILESAKARGTTDHVNN